MSTAQLLASIKQDMADFDVTHVALAERAGYSKSRVEQTLARPNKAPPQIACDLRDALDQIIARQLKTPIKPTDDDDLDDDRMLFCAGLPCTPVAHVGVRS